MRWLLTVGTEVEVAALAQELDRLGVTVNRDLLLPLDDEELVVGVDGPDDLPSRLEQAGLVGVTAYPDSELELF